MMSEIDILNDIVKATVFLLALSFGMHLNHE